MKKMLGFLLFSMFLLFPNYGMSYFPHKPNSQEIRLFVSSIEGITNENWLIEGQMIGMKSDKNLSIAGVFGMSQDSAHLGAEIIYSINPIVFVSLTGKLENAGSFGAHSRIYLDLPLGSMLSVMPFVSLNHKKVASFGMTAYFKVKGVNFSVGSAYKPPWGDNNSHNVSFMLGTGFDNIKQVQ